MTKTDNNQESYQREMQAKRQQQRIAGGLCILFLLVLFMLYTKIGLRPVLSLVGLEHILTPRGATINCNDPSYRDHPRCGRGNSAADRQWRDINRSGGKSVPFSLNDPRK